jgi:hypothetical protein
VHVAYVGSNSELDGVDLKILGLGGTADPARVFLTRVFGNGVLLCGRTLGKQVSHAPRERLHVFGIDSLTAFGCPLPDQPTGVDVGQAFLFRARERLFFNQHTLPLVPFPCSTEADHDGTERRVPAGASSERGVPSSEKDQVAEICAREAKRPLGLKSEETAFTELLATFGADGVSNDPEHYDLTRPRGLTDPVGNDVRRCGLYIHRCNWRSHDLRFTRGREYTDRRRAERLGSPRNIVPPSLFAVQVVPARSRRGLRLLYTSVVLFRRVQFVFRNL